MKPATFARPAAAPHGRREIGHSLHDAGRVFGDGGRYVIFASKAGAPNNPAWYHNLKVNPELHIEVGDAMVDVTADEVTGPERERLYETQAERMPQFAESQQNTERVIPIIALTAKQS